MPIRPPSNPHPGPLRVLVLDDEEGLRSSVSRALRRAGLIVEDTDDPRAALERLADQSAPPVDVVLCDVVMPRMNGILFGERLAERGVHVPLVYMSGLAEESALRDWGIPPTTPFLAKPFHPEELVAVVRSAAGADDDAAEQAGGMP